MPDGMVLLQAIRDGEGAVTDIIVIDINLAAEANSGASRDSVLMQSASTLRNFLPDYADLLDFLRTGEPRQLCQMPYKGCTCASSLWRVTDDVFAFRTCATGEKQPLLLEAQPEEAHFRLIAENSLDLISEIDVSGRCYYVSPTFLQVLGYTPADLLNKCILDLLHPADIAQARDSIANAVATMSPGKLTHRILHADGSWRLFESTGKPFKREDGGLRGIVISRDVTDQQTVAAPLPASEQRYRLLIDHLPDVIFTLTPAGIISTLNPAFEALTGWQASEWIGRSFIGLVHPDELPSLISLFRKNARGEQTAPHEWRIRLKSGEYSIAEITTAPRFHNGAIASIFGIARDISARKKAEEAIRYQALHDYLTGLPNRMLFSDRLREAMKMAQRHKKMLAVLFLDLDHFKQINDSCGHLFGDHVLKEVAVRLSTLLRGSDTIGRISGDELTMFLQDIEDVRDAGVVAEKILRQIARPIESDDQKLTITASIGISIYPQDADDEIGLLRCADVALYTIKNGGRNGYAYYGGA